MWRSQESVCVPKDNNERRDFLSKVTDSATVELKLKPRLVVFGFDADQKAGPTWKQHKEKLEDLLNGQVFTKGDAKDFVKGVRFQGRERAR